MGKNGGGDDKTRGLRDQRFPRLFGGMERVIDRGDAYRTERGQKDAVCPRNRAFEDRPEYRQSHRPAQEQHAEGEKRARPHPSYEAEQKHACGGVRYDGIELLHRGGRLPV